MPYDGKLLAKAREALEKYNDGMWQYIFNGEVQSPKELR